MVKMRVYLAPADPVAALHRPSCPALPLCRAQRSGTDGSRGYAGRCAQLATQYLIGFYRRFVHNSPQCLARDGGPAGVSAHHSASYPITHTLVLPAPWGAQPGRSWGKGGREKTSLKPRAVNRRDFKPQQSQGPYATRSTPSPPIPKIPNAASPATLPTASLDNTPRCTVSAANFAGTHTPISRRTNAKASQAASTPLPCTPPTRAYQSWRQ